MKRVHLFLTMLLLAIGVPLTQAQVYFTGSAVGSGNWDPENPEEAIKGTNCWFYKVRSGGFKMSTQKGNWDTFNTGCFISADGLYLGMNPAKVNNADADSNAQEEGYVCVSLDYTKVQLCSDPADFGKTQEVFEDPTIPQIYICGDEFGWDPGSPATGKAWAEPRGRYFRVTSGKGFKVSSAFGSWNDFNGGARKPEDGTLSITDKAVPTQINGTNLTAPDNGYVWVSEDFGFMQFVTDLADIKKPRTGVYLVGDPNSWSIESPKPIDFTSSTTPEGWSYKLTKGQKFKLSTISQTGGNWGKFEEGIIAPLNGSLSYTENGTAVETGTSIADLVAPVDGYVWVSEDLKYIQFVKDLSEVKLTDPTPPKKYTIRFYNSPNAHKNLGVPCVYLWDNNDPANQYKEWNVDNNMKSTGKYYKIGNFYYEVWEYEVETKLDFFNLRFHDNGKSDATIPDITGQTFEDGKTYVYYLTDLDSNQERSLVNYDAYTIYFYNATQIGATPVLNAPKVNLTTANGKDYRTEALREMTPTNKFYQIDGFLYPVWKYSVQTTDELKSIQFYDDENAAGPVIANQTFSNGNNYIYHLYGLSEKQDRLLIDKPETPANLEVYFVSKCTDFGGKWSYTDKDKFNGPDENGFFRFFSTEMHYGEDHAFNIVLVETEEGGQKHEKWIGFNPHNDNGTLGVTGGNALTEEKLKADGDNNMFFTEQPAYVRIIYSPVDQRFSIDADFSNNDPVEDDDEDVYVYFHAKYELQRKSTDSVPYCHVYNHDTDWAFTNQYTDAEKMERVIVTDHGKKGNTVDMTEKYSLWRYKIPKEHIKGVNSVIFYFKNKAGNEYYRYSPYHRHAVGSSRDLEAVNSNDAVYNDHERWTDFIYTTASVSVDNTDHEWAQQTFLSFNDFLKLDRECVVRGGRTNVYFIGGGEGMASDITGSLTTTKNEDGCFYLPTKGNRKWFKVSWIQPKDYQYGEFDSQRYWSTFDLGLVSAVIPRKADGSVDTNFYEGEQGNGKYKCAGNVTAKYENFNQADWLLPENDEDFYIVVDSHDVCHTVTILYINPQPKLKLDYSGIRTVELTAEQAAALHVHAAHLNDLATPDDAPMVTRVNIATGSVEIIGADNADTDNHSLRYVLRANGVEAGRFPDSGKYKMDMMPVADYNDPESTNDITVRAAYTDRNTGNTFHSRIATVEVTNAEDLVAPTPVEVQGNYVCTRIGSTGREYFCINSGNIKYALETDTDLAYYPDFSFDDATLNYMGHDAQKLYAGNENESKVPFVDYGEHWSEYIAKEGNFGLMIHRELREDRLVDETVEGEIHAMYPFLINPDADFVKVEQNGPAMAATAADDLDYSKLSLAMMPASAPAKVSVAADSFITTAIETVGVDTDAEVMYFNLQGIRIHNPRQGEFYLRRAGNTTEKIRF